MRFAHKLSLMVLVVLSIALSVMAYLTIQRNFNATLEQTAENYLEQHLLERYALEADLMRQRSMGEDVSAQYVQEYGREMTNYVESSKHFIALHYGDPANRIYSSIPVELARDIGGDVLIVEQQGYYVREIAGRWVMLIPSEVENAGDELWLLSVYDITTVFTERDRQMREMLWMQALVLVAAGLVVILVCNRLTRPIRRLNMTSRKIASGAYEARSDVSTGDEVGELATNFNRMAEAVETQIDQLNASVQQREDFVSAFTHEVKTPMTAIIGYSDLLRSQEVDAKTRQRAAHFIHRESRRLEALSQKLLMLMGLSEERCELLPTALNSILTDAARSVVPDLQKGYQLKIKPADDVMVKADRDLIVDVLRNLVLNALRAQPKDGAVRLSWYTGADGRCEVLVSDTGKGIKAEELERIIEPFYMVDKSRARREGSSGVGLALCQRICELHGTGLQFDSEEEVGTTVSFSLEMV